MAPKQKLSDDEIENILKDFPPCNAAIPKVATKMREQILNKLRYQLKDIQIVKTPASLNKLKEMIINMHYNSLAHPGEPVGMRAAEAFGQPTTQMALNAFHTAGAASSVGGIDAIKELYYISKNRKMENTNIHFKDKYLVYEDIFDLRRVINGVTISDVIDSSPEILQYKIEDEPYWYALYFDILGDKQLPFKREENIGVDDFRHHYLRLKFNLDKLYAKNLTVINIAEKLSRDEFTCIPSPSYIGIIDIYVNSYTVMESEKLKDFCLTCVNIYNASILYINIVLKPALERRDMIINDGIDKISEIYPKEYNVYAAFVDKPDLIDKNRNIWRMNLDMIGNILHGVPMEKIVKLLEYCNIKIVNRNKYFFEVISESDPYVIIKKAVDEAKEKLKKETNELKSQGIYKRRVIPEILKIGVYTYAQSNGTNFMKILSHPKIDPTVCTTTNPWEIFYSLGIEAARNFLIRAYIDTIVGNNHYLNPRHVTITADFQTCKGTLLQITHRGASRQNIGPLAQASFEQPMEAFIDAAVFGKEEQIKSTSTSIFVGKRMIL